MGRAIFSPKVLPNENYLVRRLNANETQILHRICVKRFLPNQPLQDNFREERLQPDEEIVIPQDDLYINTWETNFGKQLATRGKEPIPTSLPNDERPVTPTAATIDANENKVDYIIANDSPNDVNDTAQQRNERMIDDVNKRNEHTEVEKNENSDWPFTPKIKNNFCRIRLKDRKTMPIFWKKILLMKTIHKILQKGMILSCPKNPKTKRERKT